MTLAEWYAQEDKVLLFRETTNKPIFQEAIAVLRDHGLPVMRPVPQGTDAIQHGALINARREGYFECLRNLQSLSVIPVTPEVTDLRPWKKRLPVTTE
jgi:hypothetical protein